MKKRAKLFLFVVPFMLASCDFSGGHPEEEEEEKKDKIEVNSNKTDTPGLYYEEPDNKTQKDTITVIPPVKNNKVKPRSTLEKDSIHQASVERERSLQKEIELLESKIVTLRKQNLSGNLIRSTYKPKYAKVVSIYLHELYVIELKRMKRQRKSEEDLSEAFKKFHTIEYCDNRCLKWLDDFAKDRVKRDAGRMTVYYKRRFDPEAKGSDIMKHK